MFVGYEFIPGTHKLVLAELSHYHLQGRLLDQYKNLLVVDTGDITEAVVKSIMFLRTISNLYVILVNEDIQEENLEILYNIARSIDWPSIFDPKYSFAVISHSDIFSYKEVGRSVGQAIVDSFLDEAKKRPRVNLEDPDIKVHVFCSKGKLLIGLDVYGGQLNVQKEIHNRLLIASQELKEHDIVCEFYHVGVCESVYEFLRIVPDKPKLSDASILNTKILDEEKTIELVSRKWEKDFSPKVYCYVGGHKDARLRYSEITILRKKGEPCDYLFSNVMAISPRKNKQETIIREIMEIIDQQLAKKIVLLIREDIPIRDISGDKYQIDVLAKIKVSGIESKIVQINMV